MKARQLASVGILASVPALTLGLSACPQAAPVVTPVSDCAVTVIADALAGMTIEQIIALEGPRCGADLVAIVTTLLGSTRADVQATRAYKQASDLRARLALPVPSASSK